MNAGKKDAWFRKRVEYDENMARNDVFLNTTIRIIDKIESDARRKRNDEEAWL